MTDKPQNSSTEKPAAKLARPGKADEKKKPPKKSSTALAHHGAPPAQAFIEVRPGRGGPKRAAPWPACTVEMVPIKELIPYAKNARTHSPSQVLSIARSLEKFGWTNSVLRDEKNVIIAGHGRLLGADVLVQRGLKRFEDAPVITAVGWTEPQKRAYAIADNQIALAAGWDAKLLESELKEISGMGFQMDLLGFSAHELRRYLGTSGAGAGDPDNVPEALTHTVSRRGDLWMLGPHRILCGDATSRTDVSRLLGNGKSPVLMATDPPYGVDYDPAWRREISGAFARDRCATGEVENDDRSDWREAWLLFPGAVAYVWHAGKYCGAVEASLISVGFEMRSQIIWRKPHFAIGRGDYHWKHEPCQPAGTMVLKVRKPGRWREASDIVAVPIEKVRAGDQVVSFANAKVYRRGQQVTRIGSRSYSGNMHAVSVGDLTTRATAEHQFTVRFDPTKAKHAVCYLMRRDGHWRVGVCGLFNSRGFGPAVRLSSERGDELWILSAHANLSAARVAEQVVSCLYGIPTTHWETDRTATGRTAAEISQIYRQIGAAKIATGVNAALISHGLLIEHPLIRADDVGRFSRKQSRVVRACNLVPGLMQLPIPTEGERFDWRSISDVSFEAFKGRVWSMDVERDQHYVADGIVTHNCWYAVKKGSRSNWKGGRKQSTVWDIAGLNPAGRGAQTEENKGTGHGTQKPVECMLRPIENNTSEDDVVYDPFLGSGTTLIAAEQSKRICFAVELKPAYVDLAVRRWQAFTGGVALLSGRNLSFEEIDGERKHGPARTKTKTDKAETAPRKRRAPAAKPERAAAAV